MQGVIATVKHYVDNNQEYNRTLVSENVPERAQWEIYYPAFNAAVQAGKRLILPSHSPKVLEQLCALTIESTILTLAKIIKL